jgi:TPR repeat protein
MEIPDINSNEDYWLSRRPRYTFEQICNIAFSYVIERRLEDAVPLLELMAAQNHEEAQWLLAFYGTLILHDGRIKFMLNRDWAEALFKVMDNPRAIKYRFIFGFKEYPADKEGAALKLITSTDVISQYVLAKYYASKGDYETAIYWCRLAAAQNFAPANYKLVRWTNNKAEKLRLTMSYINSGYIWIKGIYDLVETFEDNIPLTTLIEARSILVHNFSMCRTTFKYLNAANLTNVSNRDITITALFIVGREFDESQKYHLSISTAIKDKLPAAIRIYRQMTGLARQAVIQTILVLRQCGLVKDIAVLIAKIVYTARQDIVWYKAAVIN